MLRGMKSLAEHLGVLDSARPDEPETPVTRFKASIKVFCRGILMSKEYRDSLLRRIMMDDLPPAVESLLYHYCYGKPKERVEIEDVTDRLENLTVEQLEERAMFLAQCAKRLRRGPAGNDDNQDVGDVGAVH